MKISELKNLSSEELLQKEQDSRKELFKLNYQRKMGRVEKPHLFRHLKKDIARIKTILHEKNISSNKQKDSKNATEKV